MYYQRFRDIREDHDIRQSTIAELLQTTQQTYSIKVIIMSTMNERLKEIRKERGITQKEVASILNTTTQQIIKYEKGTQEMTAGRLKEICEYYNISADYLLGLSEGLPYGLNKTSDRGKR